MAAYFSNYTDFFEYRISQDAFEWLEVKAGASAGTWNSNKMASQKVRVVINEPPMYIYRNNDIYDGYNMHGMPGGIIFYSPNEVKTFNFSTSYYHIGFTVHGEQPQTQVPYQGRSYRRENQFYAGFSIGGVRAINGQMEMMVPIPNQEVRAHFDTDLNDIYINTENMSEFVDGVTKLSFLIDLLPDSSGLFVRCIPWTTSMTGSEAYDYYGVPETSTNYNVTVSTDYSVDYLQRDEWAVLHYCMRWNPNAGANNLTLDIDARGTTTNRSQYLAYRTEFGLSTTKTQMTGTPITFPSTTVQYSGWRTYTYRIPTTATNGTASTVVTILFKHNAIMQGSGGGAAPNYGSVGDYEITPLVNGAEQTNNVGRKYITARDLQTTPALMILPGKHEITRWTQNNVSHQFNNAALAPRNMYSGVHKVKAAHVGTQQVWPTIKEVTFSNPTVNTVTSHDYFIPVEVSIRSTNGLSLTAATSSNYTQSSKSFSPTIYGSLRFDSTKPLPAAISVIIHLNVSYGRARQTGKGNVTGNWYQGYTTTPTSVNTFTPPSNPEVYDTDSVYVVVDIPINQTTYLKTFTAQTLYETVDDTTFALSDALSWAYGSWGRVSGSGTGTNVDIHRWVYFPIEISNVYIDGLKTSASGWTNHTTGRNTPYRYTTNSTLHTVVYPNSHDQSNYYENDVTVPVWTFNSTYNTHHRKIHARENGVICKWSSLVDISNPQNLPINNSTPVNLNIAASPAEPTNIKFAYMLNDHFYFAYGNNGMPDAIPTGSLAQSIYYPATGALIGRNNLYYPQVCFWESTQVSWATNAENVYDANTSFNISRFKFDITWGSWNTTTTKNYHFSINDNEQITLSQSINYNDSSPSGWSNYTGSDGFSRGWTVSLLVQDTNVNTPTGNAGVGRMRGEMTTNNFFNSYTVTLQTSRDATIADSNVTSTNNNTNIRIGDNGFIVINGRRAQINRITFTNGPTQLAALRTNLTLTYSATGSSNNYALDVHLGGNGSSQMLTASSTFGTKNAFFFIEATYVRQQYTSGNGNNRRYNWAVSYAKTVLGPYTLKSYLGSAIINWNVY